MTTAYQFEITIIVPENLIGKGNHLAILLGEAAADIDTFRQPNYTDGSKNYAVTNTRVRDGFFSSTKTGSLPNTPPHAEGIVDRAQANQAFNSLASSGGIRMKVALGDVTVDETTGEVTITDSAESLAQGLTTGMLAGKGATLGQILEREGLTLIPTDAAI